MLRNICYSHLMNKMTKNQKRKKSQTTVKKKTSRCQIDDEDNRSDRSFILGKSELYSYIIFFFRMSKLFLAFFM
jgi:hypothetical protein